MATPKIPFTSIDDYIASFPEATQTILAELRATIRAAAPDAEEKISYDMPTYTLNGRLIYFAAWKNHIAVYGVPASTFKVMEEEVAPYKTDKGALIFPYSHPLPLDMIRKLVEIGAEKNRKTVR